MCAKCTSSYWFQERVVSASSIINRRIVYNNCCKGGKVFVQPFKKPPPFLQELINFAGPSRSKDFIEKIRQYNCLFAFTSMGATIDRSLNNAGGPNILKSLALYVIGWDLFCLRKEILQNSLSFIVFMVEMKLTIEFRL